MIAHYDHRKKRQKKRIEEPQPVPSIIDMQTLVILAALTVAVVLLLAFLSTQVRGESFLSRAVSVSSSAQTVWHTPQSSHPRGQDDLQTAFH